MANVYTGSDVEDFIFGESSFEEVNEAVEVTDEELNTFGVIECTEDPEVACYRIALENEQNYNMIMNAMMVREFSVLESTGEEMVYEAASVKGFFDTIQAMISKFWSKVQGVFKSIMSRIQDYVSNNAAFVKKYKGQTMVKPTKDKKFMGYDFTDNIPYFRAVAGMIQSQVANNVDDIKGETFAKDFKDTFSDFKDKMRFNVINGSENGTISDSDFKKEAHMKFYGSEKKKEISLPAFAELITTMEKLDRSKQEVKKAYDESKNAVKSLTAQVKQARAKAMKDTKMGAKPGIMKSAKCLTDSINASLGIMSSALSIWTSAVDARCRQTRAMAAFYVANQPKEGSEAKNESAIDFNDLGIELI